MPVWPEKDKETNTIVKYSEYMKQNKENYFWNNNLQNDYIINDWHVSHDFFFNDQTIMVYALQHNKEHNDQNCWFPSPTPLDYPP
jgi:hypothetical protein